MKNYLLTARPLDSVILFQRGSVELNTGLVLEVVVVEVVGITEAKAEIWSRLLVN